MQGNISNVPIDVQQWLQQIASGKQDAMLSFCTQWARTLQDVQHRNSESCHPFKYDFGMVLVACLSNV